MQPHFQFILQPSKDWQTSSSKHQHENYLKVDAFRIDDQALQFLVYVRLVVISGVAKVGVTRGGNRRAQKWFILAKFSMTIFSLSHKKMYFFHKNFRMTFLPLEIILKQKNLFLVLVSPLLVISPGVVRPISTPLVVIILSKP